MVLHHRVLSVTEYRISHAAVFMLVLAAAFDLIDGDLLLLKIAVGHVEPLGCYGGGCR